MKIKLNFGINYQSEIRLAKKTWISVFDFGGQD